MMIMFLEDAVLRRPIYGCSLAFCHTLLSLGCSQTITVPTRFSNNFNSSTLLDHVYTNISSHDANFKGILYDISGHLHRNYMVDIQDWVPVKELIMPSLVIGILTRRLFNIEVLLGLVPFKLPLANRWPIFVFLINLIQMQWFRLWECIICLSHLCLFTGNSF